MLTIPPNNVNERESIMTRMTLGTYYFVPSFLSERLRQYAFITIVALTTNGTRHSRIACGFAYWIGGFQFAPMSFQKYTDAHTAAALSVLSNILYINLAVEAPMLTCMVSLIARTWVWPNMHTYCAFGSWAVHAFLVYNFAYMCSSNIILTLLPSICFPWTTVPDPFHGDRDVMETAWVAWVLIMLMLAGEMLNSPI